MQYFQGIGGAGAKLHSFPEVETEVTGRNATLTQEGCLVACSWAPAWHGSVSTDLLTG